jgi:ABC-2 type transport system ATP-binding protein
MRELLRRLAQDRGVTIFLSSHLLTEVEQICSHVGFLDRGRLLAHGPTRELLREPETWLEIHAHPEAAAVELLEALPAVRDLRREGERLLVRCAAEEIAEVNGALVRGGLEVTLLCPRQRNLEEFYLTLTEEESGA